MGILSGSGSGNFDRNLESATSQLQLEPNWASILEICDCIRQKDVTPKYAVTQIKKKIFDRNPHVSKFALVVIEACMKNCGTPFHDEVATKEFMDELRTLIKNSSDPVKEQTLSIIQAWNKALGKKPNYKIIQDTYNLLMMEGYSFPSMNESDAMFTADTAPEWAEGEVCHLCRVKFSTFTRQHHCRCCGQVFCSKCSSKNSIIPKFGIEREVRVCDPCFYELNPSSGKEKEKKTKSEDDDSDLPAEYLASALSKEPQTKPKSSEEDLKAQEEEEFQLAMALSLSAAETDQMGKHSSISETTSSSSLSSYKSGLYNDVVSDSRKAPDTTDPELSRYLNRDYWERRKEERSLEPSAPVAHHEPSHSQVESHQSRSPPNSYVEPVQGEEEENSDAFVQTMQSSLDMFIDRMQNVTARGKHIAMDTTVQSLFQSLSAMHPQLMKLIEDQEESKAKYEAMLQKLALLREARESLNDMRNQHREKLRHQELEQEMLRRMQMEQKLELMRQQKQEYLEYQRQLQIQRQQELEAQQQLKLEQRQMTRMQQPAYQYPQSEYPDYQYPSSIAGQYGTAQQAAMAYSGSSSMGYPSQIPPAQQIPASSASQPQPQIQAQPHLQHQPQPLAQYPNQYSSQAPSSGYAPEQIPQGAPAHTAAVGNQAQMRQQGPVPVGDPNQGPSSNMSRQGQDVSPPNYSGGGYVQIPQNRPQMQQQVPGSQQMQQQAYQHPQQPYQPHQPLPQTQQQQQQQQQKPMTDLLDAPIGSELDSQPPGYQQQYPPCQVPQSQPSYQSQQQPAVQQQQQIPTQQQYMPSQQYSQQTERPQQSQMPPQQPQAQPQHQLPQQPVPPSGSHGMQPQYPGSSEALYQAKPQGQAYPGQPQSQLNQQSDVANQYQQMQQQQQQPIPSQYSHLQTPHQSQGPSSLQYIPPHVQGSPGQGPASLPANINQYQGGQGYGNEAPQNYAQRPMPGVQPMQQYQGPQQSYASQPAPANTNQQELSGNMKDLQLISFE